MENPLLKTDGYKTTFEQYKEPEKSFFDQVLEAKPTPNVRDHKKGLDSVTVTIKNPNGMDEVDKALKALMANYKGTKPKPVAKKLCPVCKKPGCKLYF